MSQFTVRIATESDFHYAQEICDEMAASAKARGTGIAKRTAEYLQKQMRDGKAIIAIEKDTNKVAGFCYIEAWQGKKYTANSGLIVFPEYRKFGLARKIKYKAFKHSLSKYPNAKLFGLTTSLAVMKINSELGYHPVTFSELTEDDEFWKGCSSCVNYHILMSKERKNCLCTAMLYDPEKKKKKWNFLEHLNVVERLKRIKEITFLVKFSKVFS